MEIKEVYQHKSKDIESKIFKLDRGFLIIKHSKSQTEKLNVNQWEEINYIPDDYVLTDQELSKEEERAIRKFMNKKPGFSSEKSLPGQLIDKLKNIFN